MFLLRISPIHTCRFSRQCCIIAAISFPIRESFVNQSQNRFSGKSALAILPPRDLVTLLETYQGGCVLNNAAARAGSLPLLRRPRVHSRRLYSIGSVILMLLPKPFGAFVFYTEAENIEALKA